VATEKRMDDIRKLFEIVDIREPGEEEDIGGSLKP
jgi:hypothetical protein